MRKMLAVLMLLAAPSVYAQKKIAIFDYDDRLNQPNTIAKIIEADLKAWDKTLVIEQFSGKGAEATSVAVLEELDAKGYNLIILITSDALLLARHVVTKTQALFTNVNNPLIYGFATLSAPGRNISGATYYVPIAKQLALYKEIMPGIKKLGFIFDDTATSRRAELGESRNVCAKIGVGFETELITSKADLEAATKKLIAAKVDAIVLTSSAVIYDNADLIGKTTDPAKIPLFSFHKNAISKGAIASLSSDYVILAKEVLEPMVRKALGGTPVGTMPIQDLPKNFLSLNATKAAQLGIHIPNTVLSRADSKL